MTQWLSWQLNIVIHLDENNREPTKPRCEFQAWPQVVKGVMLLEKLVRSRLVWIGFAEGHTEVYAIQNTSR